MYSTAQLLGIVQCTELQSQSAHLWFLVSSDSCVTLDKLLCLAVSEFPSSVIMGLCWWLGALNGFLHGEPLDGASKLTVYMVTAGGSGKRMTQRLQ